MKSFRAQVSEIKPVSKAPDATSPERRALKFVPDERVSGPPLSLTVTGRNDPPRECMLLGIVRGQIHARSERWIEPGLSVTAAFAGISVPGEVIYSTPKDGWYRICIGLLSDTHENRVAPRLPFQQYGEAISLSGKGHGAGRAKVLDLSVSGMRVVVAEPVDIGTMLLIRTNSAVLVGEVRHCRETDDGCFEAGIEITDILNTAAPEVSPRTLKDFVRKWPRF